MSDEFNRLQNLIPISQWQLCVPRALALINPVFPHNVLHIDTIYLLTAIGLSPGGRNTVHIHTQTVDRTIQNKRYIEQHKNFGTV